MHTATTITDVRTVLTNSGLHPHSGYSWGDEVENERLEELEEAVARFIWNNADFRNGSAEFDNSDIVAALKAYGLHDS